jgi:hypothetical protein
VGVKGRFVVVGRADCLEQRQEGRDLAESKVVRASKEADVVSLEFPLHQFRRIQSLAGSDGHHAFSVEDVHPGEQLPDVLSPDVVS